MAHDFCQSLPGDGQPSGTLVDKDIKERGNSKAWHIILNLSESSLILPRRQTEIPQLRKPELYTERGIRAGSL
jgi:hypothetical protein